MVEGGGDSVTHGQISDSTNGGVTLGTLQADGAAEAHAATSACRQTLRDRVRYSSSKIHT